MDRTSDVYLNLVEDVQKYPGLDIQWKNNKLYVVGIYIFTGIFNNISCSDKFSLEIEIPDNFPVLMPIVDEIGNKIPSNYHKNSSTTLCLGTSIELYQIYNRDKSFSNFMENIVNPYLYRWLYIMKFHSEPWPDRSHGKKGILEGYSEILNVEPNKHIISEFLLILIDGNARLNKKCPCGSGKKVKHCHLQLLNKLIFQIPKIVFQTDLKYVEFL